MRRFPPAATLAISITVCALALFPANPARASTAYATSTGGVDASSDLFRFTSATATPTKVGEAGRVITDLAFQESTKILYGVDSSSKLYKVNTSTGATTAVGSGLGIASIDALGFCGDTLYGWTGSNIYTINISSGVASLLGAVGFKSAGDLACAADGTLFGSAASSPTDQLIKISRTTGAGTLVGTLGYTHVYGMDYDIDGRLYGASTGTGSVTFFVIDPKTGATVQTLGALVYSDGLFGFAIYKNDGGCPLLPATYYKDVDGDGYGDPATATSSCALTAPAGYSTDKTDCDDTKAAIHPGATEVCNGIDDNCDGKIDDADPAVTGQTTYYKDNDTDGYGAATSGTVKTCAASPPSGYAASSTDCNDLKPSVHPGAAELCNGDDDDCDGLIDEGVKNTYYQDKDGDGYGIALVTTTACTTPSGYATVAGDCNDTKASVNPGAPEVCNSIDDDCDAKIDDADPNVTGQYTYYKDGDGDSYGSALSGSSKTCSSTPPTGYVANASDCDDTKAAVHPGAAEVCNGFDDDCDGLIDDTDSSVTGQSTYYKDSDGDGYGATSSGTVKTCAASAPSGYAASSTDCDDSKAAVHPNAAETCNAIDDDCDGAIDENVKTTWYRDSDGDGYGSSSTSTQACSAPNSYVGNATDCDDTKSSVHPGATEACNGVDDNCDGQVDEGAKSTWYADTDSDGYGNPKSSSQACTKPAGSSSQAGDCDDTSATVYPGAVEVPYDGIDQDCSGNDLVDVDGDGYTGTQVKGGTDCDDSNSAVHPGATEIQNGIDDNCDGQVDEGTAGADLDHDGYSVAVGDCNDHDASIHPDAVEVCDGIDQDCNGLIDENTPCSDDDHDGYSEDGSIGGASDCDDADATTYPGATEYKDGKDNDCNGVIDDHLDTSDDDHDGYTETQGDCNDADPQTWPGAPETCEADGSTPVDNDCDGTIDEGTSCHDDDGDGYSEDQGDCNDGDPTTYPNAPEGTPGGAYGSPRGDGVDNNCNGTVDEGTDAYDDDGDGSSEVQGDCRDDDPQTGPGSTESEEDGVDHDCDGVVESGEASPTPEPTAEPTSGPDVSPTPEATAEPTDGPDGSPTPEPTGGPDGSPTPEPTGGPDASPTPGPTSAPHASPTPGDGDDDASSSPADDSGEGCACTIPSGRSSMPAAGWVIPLGLCVAWMRRRRR